MLYDIITIMTKELKEIFVQRGSLRSGITNVLIIVAITGILFPMQFGAEWLTNPAGLVSVAWFPLFMSIGLVADAFAGERERHTLETLLASRLSDQAILLGKMLAAVAYGFSIALAGMLLGALTANLQVRSVGFYPVFNFLAALAFSLLGTLLIAGIGVLVSLHASSVRQAYQRMSLGFLVIWLPIMLGPQFMPEAWREAVVLWLQTLDVTQIIQGTGIVLVAANLALIKIALARFQRSRLILD